MKAAVISNHDSLASAAEVVDVPEPTPSPDQFVIKAEAYAGNPTDWKHIVELKSAKGSITGSDVAGVVTSVGANVKGFKVGDQVSTFMRGNYTTKRGAFAEYVLCDPSVSVNFTAAGVTLKHVEPESEQKPGKIESWEAAAGLTLSLVTVIHSFIAEMGIKAGEVGSKAILIWGGATATGIIAIQVAKYLGFGKIIVTALKKHELYLKSLGATVVVDYHDSDVIDQIKKLGEGNIKYALDAVSEVFTYQQVYDATYGSGEVHIDNLLFRGPQDLKLDDRKDKVHFYATLVYQANGDVIEFGPAKFSLTPEKLARYNAFWKNVNPLVTSLQHPKLRVLKKGLDSVNDSFVIIHNGVTAEKVVWAA